MVLLFIPEQHATWFYLTITNFALLIAAYIYEQQLAMYITKQWAATYQSSAAYVILSYKVIAMKLFCKISYFFIPKTLAKQSVLFLRTKLGTHNH